jgi:hypothetical protein
MKDLMIDIETLGTQSYSGIISIAAVQFDLETGKTGETFFRNIDFESLQKHKLQIDASTLLWWLKQKPEVLKQSLTIAKPLMEVMTEFEAFCKKTPGLRPWGNSARFDLGLIENAMKTCGMKAPWSPWNEMCVRTIANLKPSIKKNMKFEGDAHNALADCHHQIKYLHATYKAITDGELVG